MQLPALPSENDPRFQEMLAKALALPVGDPPERAGDVAVDVEACKREMREGLEWARRNRDKWAGPKAAAPSAGAEISIRQSSSRSPARGRSKFAARRHRRVRRRSHQRVRLLSRAGPHDGPAPDEPDGPTTLDTAQGGVL